MHYPCILQTYGPTEPSEQVWVAKANPAAQTNNQGTEKLEAIVTEEAPHSWVEFALAAYASATSNLSS